MSLEIKLNISVYKESAISIFSNDITGLYSLLIKINILRFHHPLP